MSIGWLRPHAGFLTDMMAPAVTLSGRITLMKDLSGRRLRTGLYAGRLRRLPVGLRELHV
jgi:hypothetical protein